MHTGASKLHSELVGLLNKLTVEKFDLLSAQIVAKFDQLESAEVFAECVKLLHAKALLEQSFCAMYADLAKMLDKTYPFESASSSAAVAAGASPDHALAVPTSSSIRSPSPTRVMMTGTSPSIASSSVSILSTSPSMPPFSFTSAHVPSAGTTTSNTTTPPPSRIDRIRSDSGIASPTPSSSDFRSASPARPRGDSSGAKVRPVGSLRKFLLNNCYYVWQEAVDGKLPLIGEDEVAIKARNRVMGNMTFMGELYKRGLMPLKVLKSSADGLIASIRDKMGKGACAAVEPHCIMLYSLLRTVGEFMDKDKIGKPILDAYMEDMKDFASHRGFQARVRFLLRDVIDDRLNDWRPRRRFEGPMKLEDVKELHEADTINPLTLHTNERMYVPSSEFDERNKQRQSVSPARRHGSAHHHHHKERSSSFTKAPPSSSSTSSLSLTSSTTAQSGANGSFNATSTAATTSTSHGRRSGSVGASSAPTTTNAIKEPESYSSASASSLVSASSTSSIGSSPSSSTSSSPLTHPPSPSTVAISSSFFPREIVSDALRHEEKMSHVFEHLQHHHSSSERELFVYELLNWVMDRSLHEQSLIANFLHAILQKGLINDKHITHGFMLLMGTLEDITVDVPQAPGLVGKRLFEVCDSLHLISPEQKQAIIARCPSRCSAKFTREANCEN